MAERKEKELAKDSEASESVKQRKEAEKAEQEQELKDAEHKKLFEELALINVRNNEIIRQKIKLLEGGFDEKSGVNTGLSYFWGQSGNDSTIELNSADIKALGNLARKNPTVRQELEEKQKAITKQQQALKKVLDFEITDEMVKAVQSPEKVDYKKNPSLKPFKLIDDEKFNNRIQNISLTGSPYTKRDYEAVPEELEREIERKALMMKMAKTKFSTLKK